MKTIRNLGTVALAATFVLAACDSDSTGPGEGQATVQVAAQGDGDGGSQNLQSQDFLHFSQDGARAEGTVDFAARVHVQTSAGEWVELTGQQAQEVQVDASGNGAAEVFAQTNVEAGSFTRVRVEFENVRANVTGGINVGGSALTGLVEVNISSGERVTVEREINVSAGAGTETTVVVNLNAGTWLRRANAQAQAVAAADFESAVAVFAQSGS